MLIMPRFAAFLALLYAARTAADVPSTSAALETIKALDTDGSGKVERAEVEAFARSQGLSAEEVQEEFKGLDKNGDGDLEAEELTSTLTGGADTSSQSSEKDANEQNHKEIEDVGAAKSEADDTSKHDATNKVEMKSYDRKEANDQKDAKEHEEAKAEANSTSLHKIKSESTAFANVSAEVADMERDARLQAGRTLAQVFAHEAEEVLAQRSKDEEGAKALEKLAASLRLNATKLVQEAPAKVEQAAMDAADSAAKRTLGQAKILEAQAKKAEEEAAEERNAALSAMSSAMKAQNDMTSLVRRLRAGA